MFHFRRIGTSSKVMTFGMSGFCDIWTFGFEETFWIYEFGICELLESVAIENAMQTKQNTKVQKLKPNSTTYRFQTSKLWNFQRFRKYKVWRPSNPIPLRWPHHNKELTNHCQCPYSVAVWMNHFFIITVTAGANVRETMQDSKISSAGILTPGMSGGRKASNGRQCAGKRRMQSLTGANMTYSHLVLSNTGNALDKLEDGVGDLDRKRTWQGRASLRRRTLSQVASCPSQLPHPALVYW